MSYRVVLTPPAKEDVRRLPRRLQLIALAELRRLEADPVGLSRRAVFPFPPGSQLFGFSHDRDDETETWHHFIVLFRYGQDEETLHIVNLGHVEYPRET